MAEAVILENFQNQLNTLISKTVESEEKMKEDLDFFLYDNVGQKNILNDK